VRQPRSLRQRRRQRRRSRALHRHRSRSRSRHIVLLWRAATATAAASSRRAVREHGLLHGYAVRRRVRHRSEQPAKTNAEQRTNERSKGSRNQRGNRTWKRVLSRYGILLTAVYWRSSSARFVAVRTKPAAPSSLGSFVCWLVGIWQAWMWRTISWAVEAAAAAMMCGEQTV